MPGPQTLIGREADKAELAQRVAESTGGLLTIVGAGGVGKTRLAEHVAVARPEARTITVYLADRDTNIGFVSAVSDAVGGGHRARTADALAAGIAVTLRQRGCRLLILDNLEQLPALVHPHLEHWVKAVAGLWIVGTSRFPLGVRGERIHRLEPLDSSAARSLFLYRLSNSSGAPRAERFAQHESLDRVVAKCDGLPLALELAAHRASASTLEEIESELDDPLDALERATLPNAESLRNAIARSWRLLDPEARSVLEYVSVFRGSFSRASAEAVVAPSGASTVLKSLAALCRASLVLHEEALGKSRFRLLASTRQYADGMLETKEKANAELRFVAHCEELATEMSSRNARRELQLEEANLLHGFHVARCLKGTAATKIALALDDLYSVRASPLVQSHLLDTVLQDVLAERIEASAADAAELWLRKGRAERRAGRFEPARAALDRCRSSHGAASSTIARALQTSGRIALITGNYPAAEQWLREAHDCAVACKDPVATVRALRDLADLKRDRGLAETALALARSTDPLEEAYASWSLGRVLRAERALSQAQVHFRRAQTLAQAEGEAYLDALLTTSLGRLALLLGDYPLASERFQDALAKHRSAGNLAMARVAKADYGASLCAAGDLRAAEPILAEAAEEARLAQDSGTAVACAAFLRLMGRKIVGLEHTPTRTATGLIEPSQQRVWEIAIAIETATSNAEARKVFERMWNPDESDPLVVAMGATIRQLFSETPTSTLEVQVDPDGVWFQSDAAKRVTLPADSPLARILVALASSQRDGRTEGLTHRELVEAGWPGESIPARSASIRLRNAIAQLRRRGLERQLVTRGGGYLIDPATVVRFRLNNG